MPQDKRLLLFSIYRKDMPVPKKLKYCPLGPVYRLQLCYSPQKKNRDVIMKHPIENYHQRRQKLILIGRKKSPEELMMFNRFNTKKMDSRSHHRPDVYLYTTCYRADEERPLKHLCIPYLVDRAN